MISDDDLNSDLNLESILGQMGNQEGKAVTTEQSEQQNDSAVESKGAAVIVVRNGRILCGRRSDDGSICGPGGHVELGETPEQAASREAQEEFSISPYNLYHLGEYKGFTPLYLPSNVYLTTSYTGDVQTDDQEMSNARWMTLEELDGENLFPPFKAGLEMLMGALTGRNQEVLVNDG